MTSGTTGGGTGREIGWESRSNDVSGQVVGGVVQARDVYGVYLGEAAPPAATPWQLPLLTHAFVDRTEESDQLDLITAPGPVPVIAVLTGMAGVGKTAFALDWCRRNAGRFPGGLLHADLDDYRSEGGVVVADVLASFLRALGARDVPPDLPGRAALFRGLTSRASTLVLLDGVDAPAQVRVLVPASPGSVVLVASRFRLGGLVADGARGVELRPLPPGPGAELFVSAVPDGRVESDPAAVRDLVRLCGGLPMALRVAAARLSTHPRWAVADLVGHLADERTRVDRLSVEDRRVGHVFDAAYASLPEPGRLAYRALGLHPGPEFGYGVVVAATADERPEDSVEQLCQANLLEECAFGRFRFNPLVRLHARGRAVREDTAFARAGVEHRIVRWYLLGAEAADAAWFAAERDNLRSAVRLAHVSGLHDEVWRLCEALEAFDHDWGELRELGVDSARRTGDPLAETWSRRAGGPRG
ncbi:NB-ARC domain-containing protein [Saccharothrix syringae]|uniref:Uncharacterized protein n=1 Tax=Saccharothrix syringae TaxID=103733 RepID=A0A5Q0HBM4_SACSY|nr:NB-ARC domain-containing protein [Saccharothrix syringae]QFZ23062.1 hypothetical protein EKG83_41550 [Saccharothrix syringae]